MQKSALLRDLLVLPASKKEVGTVGSRVKATGSACDVRSAVRQPTHFQRNQRPVQGHSSQISFVFSGVRGPRGNVRRAYWSSSLFTEHNKMEPPLGSLGPQRIWDVDAVVSKPLLAFFFVSEPPR